MNLVSVIVPVYNVEKYLMACVNSLCEQTYVNLEIILVNDGSKDHSGQICDEFVQRDSRIKVVHKKNAGLGYARNSGLEVATGKYVTFIDSDDLADRNLIELLMKGINEANADTCIGGFKRISEDGVIYFKEQYKEEIFVKESVYDILFARMLGSAPNAHDSIRMSVWNVLYSMEIINAHNLKFPSEREFISEDIVWDSEYYKYSKCVKVVSSIAYSYRITPGSLTQKYKPQMLDMICALYNEMERRLGGDCIKTTRLQRQFFVNLRVCLKQERGNLSGKNKKEIKLTIKKIVDNCTVKRVVNEYPMNSMQFKAKLFLILIKYKFVNILGFLISMNVL